MILSDRALMAHRKRLQLPPLARAVYLAALVTTVRRLRVYFDCQILFRKSCLPH
jgi:hypothetical protein